MAKTEIDRRELTIQERQKDILERVAVLTDSDTKRITVHNQAEADFASSLANDAALLDIEWTAQPECYGTKEHPGQIPTLDKAHTFQIRFWKKIHEPLTAIVTNCKNAVRSWIEEERQRREQEARKQQKKDPLVVPEKVVVPGLAFYTRYKGEVVDLKALVKAAAKDDKYLIYLTGDQKALDNYATEKHDMTDKKGFILPGVVVVKIEGLKRG